MVIALLIEFASRKFVGSELSGFIQVVVRITGGLPSNPITATVTPSEWSAKGKCIVIIIIYTALESAMN